MNKAADLRRQLLPSNLENRISSAQIGCEKVGASSSWARVKGVMDCQTGKGKTIRKLVKLEVGVEIRGVGTWEDLGVYAERLGIEGVLLRVGRGEEDERMATAAMLEAKEYNAWGNKNRNKGPVS